MTAQTSQAFKSVLASNGQHLTNVRLKVFEALHGPRPQSMAELAAKLAGTIDRASLYRSIALFEKLGIVHRVYIGWKYKVELSDGFMAHHHHLSCLRCGTIIDIADERHIDRFVEHIAATHGFTPSQHQFEVTGYCQSCKDDTIQ